MSTIANWLRREMLRTGAACVVVRTAEAVLSSTRVRRDKPDVAADDVESSIAESAPDHRSLIVEVRAGDGTPLASRTVRGLGGRDEVGATGLLAQLMRHNERLASDNSRMFASVLEAALTENRRLSDALSRAEELRQETYVAKERLLTQATERDLILRRAEKEDSRKEKLVHEMTERVIPAVIGYLGKKSVAPAATRELIRAIARKSPEELQAIVAKLDPAEAAALEQLWGQDDGSH
jgi:ribosomal protein L17